VLAADEDTPANQPVIKDSSPPALQLLQGYNIN